MITRKQRSVFALAFLQLDHAYYPCLLSEISERDKCFQSTAGVRVGVWGRGRGGGLNVGEVLAAF